MVRPATVQTFVRRALRDLVANWKRYTLLTLGALLAAWGYVLFFIPNNTAPGGVSSLALIGQHYLGISPGIGLLLLNIPMLVLGFYQLGRFKFLIRTAYAVLVNNLSIELFIYMFANTLAEGGLTDDVLMAALYGGVSSGIGFGMILRAQGNLGGTGVLSRIIQLRTSLPISQVYLLTDGTIIFALGLVFGWESSLYALLALFISGLATDFILEGPSVVRMVFIITSKPDEVAHNLRERLLVGVTRWEGQGTHSGNSRSILFCTVMRADVEWVNTIATELDERAFVVIGQGHTVRGGMMGKLPKVAKDGVQTLPQQPMINSEGIPEAVAYLAAEPVSVDSHIEGHAIPR